MRVPVFALTLLVAAVPALSHAQVPGAAATPDSLVYARAVDPSAYTGQDYVLLLDEGLARFETDGHRRTSFRQVVQILTKDGADGWGQLEYHYDSTRTAFRLDWLRVVSPSGDVVSQGPAHEQQSTPDVPTDLPVYTDERIKRFTVGGLEPGMILDVRYTYDTFRPAYPPDFRFWWVFNSGDPVLESRFVVDLPESVTPRVTERNVGAPAREHAADGRRVLEWRADSLPALEWEPYPGTPNDVIRTVSVSAPLTWDSVAGWYHALTEGRRDVTEAIRSALPDILTGALTQRDTLALLHRWIAQDFRYVSLSLGDGGYQPRPPGAVFETKFGDCKDKTTLFVAILGTLGISAYPVLLDSDASIDSLSPTTTRFTHMIAAVETSRGREFTDLTAGATPFGRLPYDVQGKVALLVRPDGSGEIVVLPVEDPEASLREVIIGGELSADGSFDGVLTVQATGVEEPSLRELTAGATEMDATELKALGERIAWEYFDRAVVDSTQALDGLDLWSAPALAVWLRVPAVVTNSGNRRVLPLPLPDYSMTALRRELEQDSVRLFPVDAEQFNGPSKHRTEFVVDLPPGWQAELPPNVEVAGTFGRYRSVYAQQGRTVRAMRELAGRRGIEPPDSAAALIAWLGAVGEDRAQYLVIEELSGMAVRDSLSGLTSLKLAFGWPVGMEARVRQRVSQLRTTPGATVDSSTSETSYRMSVADHELGRVVTFGDFTVIRESDAYRPGLEGMVDRAARFLPGFVVDESGTFLGFDRLDAFLERIAQALRPMIDSLGATMPGLRALMERTLSEEFYRAKALELWAPLVFTWSDVEMQLGVPYESEADEPSPLFPDRLITSNYTHQLESRVPCRDGRTDSACVRLVMRSRTDPVAVKNLLTEMFAEMLRDARVNVPVIEQMDVGNTATLISEPETLIPHHLLVTQDIALTMRDSTGRAQSMRQLREREYWFEYREFHAEAGDSSTLLRAAAAGDVAAATEALRDGEDPEQRDPLGRTPLMVAAANGNEPVVRLLLFRGASPDATDRTGASALVWAAAGGHDDVVRRLLQAGASLDRAWEAARAVGFVAAVPALRRAGLPAPAMSAPQLLDSARTVYNGNDLENALPLFFDAFASDTSSVDALAWTAEVLRRRGRQPEALAAARFALARDSCHGHALGVVAAVLDPQFEAWAAANADSAWHYVNRAVACAPDDGNGWLAIVFKAAERGDETLEREALRRLLETGFLTTSVQALARWLLESLPDGAVLVTNGDLDTYPLLALQVVEGVRPDVAVVNRSLLNLGWYREQMIERHGLPRPETFRDALASRKDEVPEAALVTVSDSTIALWRAGSLDGRLARPLAFSVTALSFEDPEGGPGELELRGAYGMVVDSAAVLDPEAVYGYYAGLDARDFREPTAAAEDRSAVRQNSDVRWIIPFTAMIAAAGVAEDDWNSADTTTLDDIGRLLQWADRFTRESGLRYAEFIHEGLSDAYTDLGWAYAGHRRHGDAIRLGKAAAALNAENVRALGNVGYYSLLAGELDSAVAYSERAYDVQPQLATLLTLVDANRLRGDLAAAARWGGEAEALAVGKNLEDEDFMSTIWSCDYLGVAGGAEALPGKAPSLESADEKLALTHYWIAITEAAADRWEGALAHLSRATDLSPRVDIHCLVHDRIDATVSRFADEPETMARLRALGDRLTARDAACGGG